MTTPVRRQYLQIKRQYPDAILFFRLGDFYETFDEDAKTAARELDIVLTSRNIGKNQRIPLAGIPYHAAEGYIARLINKGYKVAICEQVGEPVKGLMPREVVRVVTPGTVVEESLLEQRRNNYLVALVVDDPSTDSPRLRSGQAGRSDRAGLAYADITTGDFATTQWAGDDAHVQAAQELQRLQPRECLYCPPPGSPPPRAGEGQGGDHEMSFLPDHTHLTPYEPWRFELETARQALLRHFDVATLEGYGCAGWPAAIQAAGALIQYLQETQPAALTQLTRLQSYSTAAFMTLDPATRRNLELNESTRDRALKGSLLWVLDATETAMGGRLLRRWLNQPLLDLEALVARQDAVAALHDHVTVRAQVRAALHKVADLERLTGRVVQGIAGPRALVALRESLEQVPALRNLLEGLPSPSTGGVESRLSAVISALDPAPDTVALIAQAITDDPPAAAGEGTIRPGFSAELDGVRALARGDRDWVARLERTERERIGIKSLKVGYNKVFGYYLEVTKPNLDLVPADYIRKQTLVNAERFITPELKEVEARILNAEERMGDLETAIYRQVLEQVAAVADRLTATAHALAELDVYAALAEVAERNRYGRPALTTGDEIHVVAGRHPVVELTTGEPFVPNDAHLSNAEGQIILLTGPNMSGKCVAGNTLIFTDRGLATIKDLMPNNAREGEFTEINSQVRGLNGKSYATHFYNGGQRTTIKLVTHRGYYLEGTPEHRVWVRQSNGSEGWKQLADIVEGDIVAIERQIDLWGRETWINCSTPGLSKRVKRYRLPDELSEDLAYMMGLLVGDGTLTYRNSVMLSTGDSFIADEYHRIVDRLFGYQVGRKANDKDFFITSKQIRVFLANLGLGYGRAHEKQVPRSVLGAPKHIVIAFLQGLFDADGYAENRYGNVRFSTASIRLAREVQMLLLNLGIIASLRVKETVARPSYRISINGADAISFHRQVGFRLPRKRERNELASDVRMPNIGGIPHLANALKQVQARIVAATDKPVALKRSKSINSIFCTYVPSGRNISYDKLRELIDYCHQSGVDCPELEDLEAKRYFYDGVETVNSGETEVYDLSVAGDQAYVANGFVSHNSTYLRQTALICLMAQIGSFVPAQEATIGLVDRIFTRVGAQDDIATGQSTFMVEMVETALILQNATPRSLIILDEIGRGTSTYDGVAIARAVVEYLHNNPRVAAKTIFATHYHELTELEGLLPRVRNFNVAVLEEGNDVVFLRQVVPGPADRSYGIHVARMAGVPRAVTHRAEDVLAELESLGDEKRRREAMGRELRAQQLSFLPSETHPVLEAIRELKVEELTPLEAINKLYELQREAKEDAS